MKVIQIIFSIFSFIACISCNKNEAPAPSPSPVTPAFFAKGADVSWLTQMEASGIRFYDSTGVQTECMSLLKSLGMNSTRLRVWVNPAGGWCNANDVLAKATRAKNLGMKILLDFHYSDSWADPGQQNKPAAWATQDFTTLKNSVYQHTFDILTTLKAANIVPEWVQVGNETNDGMLWPDGKASTNMANFAKLINAGYDAVKAVNPGSKVMVHISNGYDNNLFRWIFDGLQSNGAHWDIIGMSLYPSSANWPTLNAQCLANMNDMVSRYGKEVMVCEVGMSWDQSTACYNFITDLTAKIKSVTGNKGLGIFYWEPEAHNNWQGYTLGAFDNSGTPTRALQAFKE